MENEQVTAIKEKAFHELSEDQQFTVDMTTLAALPYQAELFARAAHDGQLRDYTGEPYITHPQWVAAQAVFLGLSAEAVAAAWLHDVIEDCKVAPVTIYKMFGTRVGFLVEGLTDLQDPKKDGSRWKRKGRVIKAISDSQDMELQTLKLLDVAHNAKTLAGYAPKFWHTMKKEATAMVLKFDAARPKARKMVMAHLTRDELEKEDQDNA